MAVLMCQIFHLSDDKRRPKKTQNKLLMWNPSIKDLKKLPYATVIICKSTGMKHREAKLGVNFMT